MAGYVPPETVRAAARRGLDLVAKGKAGDGFEPATAVRARRIAAGQPLTAEHVKRMHSFHSRHASGRSKTAGPGEITPWDVANLAWGGKSGAAWARSVVNKIANNKSSK